MYQPTKHLDFLARLRLLHRERDYIFTSPALSVYVRLCTGCAGKEAYKKVVRYSDFLPFSCFQIGFLARHS